MAKRKEFTNAVGVITTEYDEDQYDPIGKPREGMLARSDESTDDDAANSVDEISPLDERDARLMAQQEARIGVAILGFYEIGDALDIIRRNKLYRGTHKTWDSYTKERWDLNRGRVYQMIDAARVVADIAKWKLDVGRDSSQTNAPLTAPDGTAIEPTIVKNKKPAKLDRTGKPEDVDFTEGKEGYDGNSSELSDDDDQESDGGGAQQTTPVPDEPAEPDGDWLDTKAEMPLPTTESHAAALVGVDPADRGKVWGEVVEQARQDGKPITAAQVKEKVAKKIGGPAVPLNKKAPRGGPSKDRKPRKSGGDDQVDDLDGSTLDLNRFTSGSKVSPYVWSDPGEDEDDALGFNEDDTSLAPGSREANIVEMGRAMRKEAPAYKEVTLTVTGSWLIRAGVAELWQRLWGDDTPINEEYKVEINLQDANEMKLMAILARL